MLTKICHKTNAGFETLATNRDNKNYYMIRCLISNRHRCLSPNQDYFRTYWPTVALEQDFPWYFRVRLSCWSWHICLLIFYPENGGNNLLRIFDDNIQDYKIQCRRSQYKFIYSFWGSCESVDHASLNFVRQMSTLIIVSWSAGRTWKNDSNAIKMTVML